MAEAKAAVAVAMESNAARKKQAKKAAKKVAAKAAVKQQDPGITRYEAIKDALGQMPGGSLYDWEKDIITASKIQLPTGYLSPSAIDTYLGCPMQYKKRYIDKIKDPPAVALEEGTSHHSALERNNLHRIKTGENLPVKDVYETFADSFVAKSKEIEQWEGDTPDEVIGRGRKMLSNYMQTFAPSYYPRQAERCIAVPVGPVPVVGFIDTEGDVGGSGHAKDYRLDYKTVSRAKSQGDADNSIQLGVYAYEKMFGSMAAGGHADDVNAMFVCLTKSSGRIKSVETTISVKRVQWVRQIILHVANQISLGNFPLVDPNNWRCSERFCGAWHTCRGRFS